MSRLLVLAVALLASGASAQTMYKCVDSRGVTRYSDQPQPGCKGREVNIRGQPPISDTPPSRREEPDEEERDEQRRNKAQAERIREAQPRAKVAGKLVEMPIYAAARRLLESVGRTRPPQRRKGR